MSSSASSNTASSDFEESGDEYLPPQAASAYVAPADQLGSSSADSTDEEMQSASNSPRKRVALTPEKRANQLEHEVSSANATDDEMQSTCNPPRKRIALTPEKRAQYNAAKRRKRTEQRTNRLKYYRKQYSTSTATPPPAVVQGSEGQGK